MRFWARWVVALVLVAMCPAKAESSPTAAAIDTTGFALVLNGGGARGLAHISVLKVLEELSAGDVPTKRVPTGTATRIMTGAPIPYGADAVVMIERTE